MGMGRLGKLGKRFGGVELNGEDGLDWRYGNVWLGFVDRLFGRVVHKI